MLTIAEETEPAAERTRVRVSTRKSTKPPWNSVKPRTIEIPRRWLIELYSSNMVAFAARTIQAIIPVNTAGNLLAESEIDENGWLLLDDLYKTHAGRGRHTPAGLIKQIDHLRKLSVQLPLQPKTQRKLVLYPKSGDLMRAARCQIGHRVVDHSLYWYRTHTSAEAAYLTVVLNAR